ncbi:MAG: AI-2E family transporter [Ferruginibacter sp.]
MPGKAHYNGLLTEYLQVAFFSAIILYLGKTLFIPLFFGLLIAIVMHPVCKWLELHGIKKIIAITVCLLIVSVLFAALLALLIWQLNVFGKDAPAIFQKAATAELQLQQWLISKTGINLNIAGSINDKLPAGVLTLAGSAFETTISTLFIFFITPVYTALFMYHRKVFVQYLKLITPEKYLHKLDRILAETIHTYSSYIKSMVLVYIIVGILNSLGLYALGVKNAILFGMLCAIMTIIPYIGIIVSAMLPISVIWLETGNPWYPLGVVAVFSFVQYLEANVIFPKVVGTQLQVSTMAMLVAIIAGGIIWGVAGMILFIPFAAILKIISDNIEEWKALNLLLSRKQKPG